jgi:hypothetical protein
MESAPPATSRSAAEPPIRRGLYPRRSARAVARRPRAVVYCHPVRRSVLLKVMVFCPHFQRAVQATRNQAIDRLVACDDADGCRDTAATAASPHEHARVYPHGCPVFPSLAK